MSSPIKNLREDVSRKIGVNPIEDKLSIIKVKKSRFTSLSGKFGVECKGLKAPTPNDEYSLYMIGRVKPEIIGLNHLNISSIWYSGKDIINSNGTKDIFLYTDKGYVVPNDMVYFIKTRNDVVYFAIKNPRSLSYMDLDTVYYRHYDNRWLRNNNLKGIANTAQVAGSSYPAIYNTIATNESFIGGYNVTQLTDPATAYLMSPLKLSGDFEVTIDRTQVTTDEVIRFTDVEGARLQVNLGSDGSYTVMSDTNNNIITHTMGDKLTLRRERSILTIRTGGLVVKTASITEGYLKISRRALTVNAKTSTITYNSGNHVPWDSSVSHQVIPMFLTPEMVRQTSKVHINGMYVKAPIGVSAPNPTDSLDIHTDTSVRGVVHLSVKSMINFRSEKDKNNKYIIPVGHQSDDRNRITHYTDVDIYITYRRGSSNYVGLYYGMHNPKNVSMVTNDRIGISVDQFNIIGNELIKRLAQNNTTVTLNDLHVTVTLKRQSRIMNILPSDNNLHILSRMTNLQKYGILSGKDGISMWAPEKLENSAYFRFMDMMSLENVSEEDIINMLGYDGLLNMYPNIAYPKSPTMYIEESNLYKDSSPRWINYSSTGIKEHHSGDIVTPDSSIQVLPNGIEAVIYEDTRAVTASGFLDLTWVLPNTLVTKRTIEVHFNGKALVEDIDYFISDGEITVTSLLYASDVHNSIFLIGYPQAHSPTATRVKYYEYGFVSQNGLISYNDVSMIAPSHITVFGGRLFPAQVSNYQEVPAWLAAPFINKPYMVRRPLLNMDDKLGEGVSDELYNRAIENYFRIEKYALSKSKPRTVYESQIVKYDLYSPFLEDIIKRAEAIVSTNPTGLDEVNTQSELLEFGSISEPFQKRDPAFKLNPKFAKFVSIHSVSRGGRSIHSKTLEFAKAIMTTYNMTGEISNIDQEFNII